MADSASDVATVINDGRPRLPVGSYNGYGYRYGTGLPRLWQRLRLWRRLWRRRYGDQVTAAGYVDPGVRAGANVGAAIGGAIDGGQGGQRRRRDRRSPRRRPATTRRSLNRLTSWVNADPVTMGGPSAERLALFFRCGERRLSRLSSAACRRIIVSMSTARRRPRRKFELQPYKSLDNDELQRRIQRGARRAGPAAADPRPPLSAGRSDRPGRPERRQLPAQPDGGRQPRLPVRSRSAASTSWPRRPTSWPTGRRSWPSAAASG